MSAIILDEHRNRFRSDADFDFFVSLFEGVDMIPIWAKSQHLATLLSPANAKSFVQDRMLQKILDNPSVLDDVRDRLAMDEIVD